MLIFIDESGIHRQDGKSTTALVYVEAKHADVLNKAVLDAEQKLKIQPFHWTEHGWKVRRAFLELVIEEEFKVKIFVFKNPFSQKKFEFALVCLFTSDDNKSIENIVLDGKKSRHYVMKLKQVLKESNVSVRKIRTGNDRGFPCLRLADLFAGLVRAYMNSPDRKEAGELYALALNKITTPIYRGGQVPDKPFLFRE